jgi:Arc/MetJ family transcription regulator
MLIDAMTRHVYVFIVFTHRLAMRTNIDIDDALIAEAMAASGLTTKKAVVEEALRRLVHQKQEEQTLALYGTVDWKGDLEQSRLGRADAE